MEQSTDVAIDNNNNIKEINNIDDITDILDNNHIENKEKDSNESNVSQSNIGETNISGSKISESNEIKQNKDITEENIDIENRENGNNNLNVNLEQIKSDKKDNNIEISSQLHNNITISPSVDANNLISILQSNPIIKRDNTLELFSDMNKLVSPPATPAHIYEKLTPAQSKIFEFNIPNKESDINNNNNNSIYETSIFMENLILLSNRVIKDCQTNYSINVSQILATYVVRSMSFTDPIKYDLTGQLTSSDFLELVKISVAQLITTSPLIDTIKLQVTFHSVYSSEEQKLMRKKQKVEQNNDVALKEIIDMSNNIKSETQLSALYKKVFLYITSNSLVEVTRQVEREIAAAMESVFPKFGLKAWSELPIEEKEKQIKDLASIVFGIRLFNKGVNKGGSGIFDVFQVIGDEITELLNKIIDESQIVYEKTVRYCDVIEFEYKNSGSISASLTKLQEELILRRQYLAYTRQLQAELIDVMNMISSSRDTYNDQLDQFKKFVGERSSVPKEDVYPRFQLFARFWTAVFEERDKNEIRRVIHTDLRRIKDGFQSSLTPSDELNAHQVIQVEGRVKVLDPSIMKILETCTHSDGSNIAILSNSKDPLYNSIFRLTANSAPDIFMQLPMEYQGFCGWNIVHRSGLLLPGNPAVGLLIYRGKFYSFAEPEGMLAFIDNPEKYVVGVLQEVQNYPPLIHMIRVQDAFPYASITSFIEDYSKHPDFRSLFDNRGTISVDAGCETPLHMVESNIDPNYDWNEWSMRRKALQLANIRNMKTHSTQTNLSHYKRDSETQVTIQRPLKDGSMPGVGTQVGINVGTLTDTVKTHLTGLRGSYDSKPHVVEMNVSQIEENLKVNRQPFLLPKKEKHDMGV